MAREPSYPEDAPVAGGSSQPRPERVRSPDNRQRNKQLVKGAAIGIGSAAIVAALLYAGRSKRDDKNRR